MDCWTEWGNERHKLLLLLPLCTTGPNTVSEMPPASGLALEPTSESLVTTQWTTGAWTLTHGGCHPNLGARVAKEDLLSPAVDERAALVQSFSEWLMSHCGQGRRLGRTWTQILSSPQAPSRIQDRNRGCLSPVDGPHHHGASLCPQRSTVLSEGTLPWGTMGE